MNIRSLVYNQVYFYCMFSLYKQYLIDISVNFLFSMNNIYKLKIIKKLSV